MRVSLSSLFDDAPVRLEILAPGGSVHQMQVESVSGKRVRGILTDPVTIGTTIKLETSQALLLGQVVGLDSTGSRPVAVIDIEHWVLNSESQRILSYLHSAAPPSSAPASYGGAD